MRKPSISGKFLFAVNIAVAVALLLAYLAAILHPAKFWWPSFFGLLYPLWTIVCLIFLVLWLWRRPRRALVSAIVLLPFLPIHLRYISFPTGASADADDLRVLSWNVRLFNKYESTPYDRADEMVDYLASQEADLICLQEFYTATNGSSKNYLRLLKEETGLRYHHMVDAYRYPSGATWGVLLLSRYPLAATGAVDFSASFTRNGCLYADIEVNGEMLRIYNAHLQSIKLTADDIEHVGSVSGLRETEKSRALLSKFRHAWAQRAVQSDSLAISMARFDGPVIVCGDFNDTPVSYAYRRVARNMQDAFVKAGAGLGSSHTGLPGLRIDYLLFDEDFTLTDYAAPRMSLSDHYPVMADFRLE